MSTHHCSAEVGADDVMTASSSSDNLRTGNVRLLVEVSVARHSGWRADLWEIEQEVSEAQLPASPEFIDSEYLIKQWDAA